METPRGLRSAEKGAVSHAHKILITLHGNATSGAFSYVVQQSWSLRVLPVRAVYMYIGVNIEERITY